MHPFFEPTLQRRLQTLAQLTENAKQLGESLGSHDCALKVWLPIPVFDELEDNAGLQGEAISAWLRGFFAVHCYGLIYVTKMLKLNPKVFKTSTNDSILFSQRGPPEGYVSQTTYFVPQLGKNTAPVKVWIADVQRQHLKLLAKHVDITVGQYCREILTAQLLGHARFQCGQKCLKPIQHLNYKIGRATTTNIPSR